MPTPGSFTTTTGVLVAFTVTITPGSIDSNTPTNHRLSVDYDSFAVFCGIVGSQLLYEQNKQAFIIAIFDALTTDASNIIAAGQAPPQLLAGLSSAAATLEVTAANRCLVAYIDGDVDGNALTLVLSDINTIQQSIQTQFLRLDGSSETRTTDLAGIYPWDTHTVATDAYNQKIADTYDYATSLSTWFNAHTLAVGTINAFDAAEASSFAASWERSVYIGDAVSGGVDGIFMSTGPSTLFFTGGFNLDIENGFVDTNGGFAGTSISLDAATYGYDNSALDTNFENWGWNNSIPAYEVPTFDGWDYGDWYEPVILDLDGNGINITPRDVSKAEFDVDGDGFDENVAWVGAGDGLLAIDLNSATGAFGADGIMSRREEIAFAAQESGQTDLEALKANYDSNNDGQLTAADAHWADFRIWKDLNGDGYSDPDDTTTTTVNERELFTLAELGITSINLTRVERFWNAAGVLQSETFF